MTLRGARLNCRILPNAWNISSTESYVYVIRMPLGKVRRIQGGEEAPMSMSSLLAFSRLDVQIKGLACNSIFHHDEFTLLMKCKREIAITNGIEPRPIRHKHMVCLVQGQRFCSNGLFKPSYV